MRRFAPWPLIAVALACSPAPPPASRAPEPAPAHSAPPAAAPAPTAAAPPASSTPAAKLDFLHDDVPGAMARARREGKALFIDAWAPWCHTCLSMKHYVFVDPSLAPLAERMLFVAVDTDREQNAEFVEKYPIDAWPTFFILDPEKGDVLGFWPGAASVREIRDLSLAALEVFDADRSRDKSPDPNLVALVRARAAQAERRYDQAASGYATLVARAPRSFPQRSEAIAGWVSSLSRAGRAAECAEVGLRHLDQVTGAALPADFSRTVFGCASALENAAKRRQGREAVLARLRALVASPPVESSLDDRADALDILAWALEESGDAEGTRQVHEQRLQMLEQAAKSAPTPQAASTYDYQRATAYLALGRAEEAVKMLEQRETELPDSYEPPARLASVLAEMRRYPEALAAIDRALAHAYGPRRLRYLALKARIQRALGDRTGQTTTLEQEVAGWKALGKRAAANQLKDAERRLAAARRGAR
jgi:tetratricopeptide (TPR) repeat protein